MEGRCGTTVNLEDGFSCSLQLNVQRGLLVQPSEKHPLLSLSTNYCFQGPAYFKMI
ncbi:hypothetical protein HispidOSU_001497, partial [Sigmodon hispidus]